MPSVTYNGQSFAVDGRRVWILGASIQYARIPRELWPARIAAAKQAGFNTVETGCPWFVHEPRRDRFTFEGQADVREFISLCGRAGMRVILRPGPFIGTAFDGGGLPSWLTQSTEPGYAVREANEIFLERVNIYFRRLLSKLDDLQATRGGPILLVQSEHAWLCASADQADRYLREVTRVIRESGFNVPVINANDLWQESPGTIDTWRGGEDLLAHLRQLRTVQPDAPRLLSALDAAEIATWGETPEHASAEERSDEIMLAISQCLAAGAQPVVSPFAAGTNFDFLGGRLPGGIERFAATSAATHPPLGEAGHRGPSYRAAKRIVSFASHFDHVFAELDSSYHPIVEDAFAPPGSRAGGRRRRGGGASGSRGAVSIVPLRGTQGQIVFVFSEGTARDLTLLLEDGLRLPVHLGDQRVGWYVIDADLKGSGHLDYANLSPYAIVDRSMLVLHGPASSPAYLSINGTPLHHTVPTGDKPLVIDHKGITIIICNREQIDRTYHDLATVFVGACGMDDEGRPIAEEGRPVWAIARDGGAPASGAAAGAAVLRELDVEECSPFAITRTLRKPPRLGEWTAAPAAAHASGASPRYATLEGPETLAACGSPAGYGWYRITVKGGATARKRLCHLPQAADRIHLYLDGGPAHVFGVGPGADPGPFDLRLGKGELTLAVLADNLGRFADGNELVEPKGLFGHLYEVKPLRAVKPKSVKAAAVDPFSLRKYIAGLAHGQLSDTAQIEWAFKHTRKTPILVDVRGAEATGTFVLNDRPVAYFAGAGAACHMRLLLDAEAGMKRGNNVLRFAPDPRQAAGSGSREAARGVAEQIIRATALFECTDAITHGASWAFAKWEPPMLREHQEVSRTAAKSLRGVPCWWRTTFPSPAPGSSGSLDHPIWFDTAGLSKGQLYLNGHNLGRYFTATATGKAVGPQTRLFVPSVYLRQEGENELLIFDEHGFDPWRCALVAADLGDLD